MSFASGMKKRVQKSCYSIADSRLSIYRAFVTIQFIVEKETCDVFSFVHEQADDEADGMLMDSYRLFFFYCSASHDENEILCLDMFVRH